MNNYSIAFVVLAVVVLGVAAMWPDQAAPQAEEERSTIVSITGCLKAGEGDGAFVLIADDQQSYKVQPADELDLAIGSHASHRVELTGIVEKTDANQVFKVAALMMIASSCEPL